VTTDPFNGRQDIDASLLRAVDIHLERTVCECARRPVRRAFQVPADDARSVATFPRTICRRACLGEIEKLLLQAGRPSCGLVPR
jgi:hypothetical protein